MKISGIILTGASLAMAVAPAMALNQQQENFKTGTRAFYLWRCGTEIDADYNGNHYHIDACHLNDGHTDYIFAPGKKDGTGGWHDAGDFGKYTNNAAITLANLFWAWDHFGDKIKKVSLDIPETAPGYPDFLKELKWETDWMLKMQYPDGSGRVSHKLTRKNFADFIMPEADDAPRYFTTWGSQSTADFAAAMAMAARYFAPYDKAYADKCLEAAKLSYKFLTENPHDEYFVQGDFSTGGYQSTDPDDRLWAAAEIWESTGSPEALADVEARIAALGDNIITEEWDWGDLSNLGVWTYATSKREGRNPELLKKVKEAIKADAKAIADRINNDKYGCPLIKYFWGCNGQAARYALNLMIANKLGGPNYKKELRKINDWLLGNNYYGRSFVTGIGPNPPMHPHDRRSAADGIEDPWPGYLVGGGHTETDWVDEQDDYSRNEIAINWQAGLVYVLASQL